MARKHGQEELPHIRGRSSGREELTHATRLEVVARRSCLTPKVRGGGPEEQPHVQGAVAARVQGGLEELLHVQG